MAKARATRPPWEPPPGELRLPPVPPLPRAIPPSRQPFDLDTPLLAFSKRDRFTINDATQGIVIIGGTGSAKTTSSGKMLAKAFLRAGMGGLVLCAKTDEAARWLRYCGETDRGNSVVLFDGTGRHRFNFLSYAATAFGRFDALNVVKVLMSLIEASKGGDGSSGGGDNQIWTDLTHELLSASVALLWSAHGRIVLAELIELVNSAPRSIDQANDPAWQSSSFCFQTIVRMVAQPAHPLPEPDQEVVGNYFRRNWAQRHDKMRSSIEANLTASLYPFQTGLMRELFTTYSTITPEAVHQGVTLILDLPIKRHHAAGKLAQLVWKMLFQMATEVREVEPTTRPVYIWADEAHLFLNREADEAFQGTARSKRACTVYITQNLPTLYSAMGGKNPTYSVNSLLGNFQTKIFHQNTCADTNKWASDIINKRWQWVGSVGENSGRSSNDSEARSRTNSYGGGGGGSTSRNKGTTHSGGVSSGTNTSASEQLHEELLPSTFLSLRKGGGRLPPEAIVLQGGTPFHHGGRNWLRCQFPQG